MICSDAPPAEEEPVDDVARRFVLHVDHERVIFFSVCGCVRVLFYVFV